VKYPVAMGNYNPRNRISKHVCLLVAHLVGPPVTIPREVAGVADRVPIMVHLCLVDDFAEGVWEPLALYPVECYQADREHACGGLVPRLEVDVPGQAVGLGLHLVRPRGGRTEDGQYGK